MAYGDITGSPHAYRAPSIPGVQTARRAVLLKDDTTFGSNAVDYLNNTQNLAVLNTTQLGSALKGTERGAGLYVGTAGHVCVLLSGQKVIIDGGSATGGVTNKLADDNQNFTSTVMARDLVVNTTDGTAAFVGNVDSDTRLSLVNHLNVSVDIMAVNELYEIYRPVVFQNVAAGSFLPIEVNRIFALGTTASDIIAIY
jgi:hypothetical protein|tara:strand:- start:178 stop:771 length:594 start_codon:yes stop_codon:yes gene_type:complete